MRLSKNYFLSNLPFVHSRFYFFQPVKKLLTSSNPGLPSPARKGTPWRRRYHLPKILRPGQPVQNGVRCCSKWVQQR